MSPPYVCMSSSASAVRTVASSPKGGFGVQSGTPAYLPVLWIRVVEAAAGVPFRALVAMHGNAARVLEDSRDVEQVPRHEGGVAVREVVVRPAGALVQITRARAGLAEPAGVG